jgi:hypothetical protein
MFLMSLTVNADTYTADSFQADIVGYRGPDKTASVKDDVRLARTAPKPSASFSGVGRTSAKLTRTLTLTGALSLSGDMIVDIQCSVPVGFSGTDVDAALNDFGAFLASATFKTHVKNLQIAY